MAPRRHDKFDDQMSTFALTPVFKSANLGLPTSHHQILPGCPRFANLHPSDCTLAFWTAVTLTMCAAAAVAAPRRNGWGGCLARHIVSDSAALPAPVPSAPLQVARAAPVERLASATVHALPWHTTVCVHYDASQLLRGVLPQLYILHPAMPPHAKSFGVCAVARCEPSTQITLINDHQK